MEECNVELCFRRLTALKLIIADDAEHIQNSLVKLLSMLENVSVVGQSHDVDQTKALIESTAPDAVILDIQMPGGTGIDVLKHYKSSPPKPIFIILTNFSSEAYRKKCQAEGADYFFDKSEEFEQLINLLSDLSR